MRKITIFGLLLFLSSMAYSQQPLLYSDVVRLDTITTNKDLYARALIWLTEYYDNSASIIQLKDDENCLIIGKASMIYEPKIDLRPLSDNGFIYYTIKIYCKNGRYKYEIGEFVHQATSDPDSGLINYNFGLITDSKTCKKEIDFSKLVSFRRPNKEGIWSDMQSQIKNYAANLIESLKVGMSKKIETKQPNW